MRKSQSIWIKPQLYYVLLVNKKNPEFYDTDITNYDRLQFTCFGDLLKFSHITSFTTLFDKN